MKISPRFQPTVPASGSTWWWSARQRSGTMAHGSLPFFFLLLFLPACSWRFASWPRPDDHVGNQEIEPEAVGREQAEPEESQASLLLVGDVGTFSQDGTVRELSQQPPVGPEDLGQFCPGPQTAQEDLHGNPAVGCAGKRG